MRQVTAVIVQFPPDIEINPSPTGRHDKLQGMAVSFYNQVMVDLNLNFTLTSAKSLGRCTFDNSTGNTTCDGAVQELATGRADYSLIPMSLTSYDPRIKEEPIRFGPKLFDSEIRFTSMPYEGSHSQDISVLETVKQIPLFHCLSVAVYLIVLLMINQSVRRKKRITRINFWQMWGVIVLRPNGKVRTTRRRILYVLCLFLSFMNYQFFLGSTKSDMVVVIPAKYYETVEDVASSNRTVTWVQGLTVDEHFEEADDPLSREILQRTIARGSRYPSTNNGVFTTLAQQLNQTIQFHDSYFESMCIIGLRCYLDSFVPLRHLRLSNPIAQTVGIVTYSRLIDPALRAYLTRFYQRLVDTGIYHRYQSDIRESLSPLGDTDRLVLCMIQRETSDTRDSTVPPWNLYYYADLLFILSIAICSAFLALAHESIKRKRVKEVEEGLTWGWKLVRGRTIVINNRST